MRKNQAAQSIALAFGLAGGLGFLGYTLLGDMLVSDPDRTEQVVPAPTPKKRPTSVVAARPVSVLGPAVHPRPAPAAMTPDALTIQMASSANALTTAAPAVQAAPVQTAQIQAHTVPSAVAAPVVALPRPAPASHVVLAPPPSPVPAAAVAQGTGDVSEAATSTKRGHRRRRAREDQDVIAQAAPATVKVAEARTAEPAPVPKAAPAPAPAPVQPIAATVIPVKTVPTAERKPAVGVQANTAFTSKDDMAVTISGQKAWVQVSPTRTMEAKKGDVLPNLGKILEIRGNQVVAEKGTLTTN